MRVVVPIPDPSSLDLSTIIDFTLFLIFTLDFAFLFLKVAIRDAPVLSVPRFLICRDFPFAETSNLSALSCSVFPSDLIRTYLSSSNGRKTSPVPASTATDSCPLAISTLKVFLIVIVDSEISTAATFGFGKGVYRVLSEEEELKAKNAKRIEALNNRMQQRRHSYYNKDATGNSSKTNLKQGATSKIKAGNIEQKSDSTILSKKKKKVKKNKKNKDKGKKDTRKPKISLVGFLNYYMGSMITYLMIYPLLLVLLY